jgi:adenine-specific DNA-methyltransferase
VIATPLKRTKKKRRGVFYTPASLSDILCQWAIRDTKDLVLEPSFGGCGFIQALTKRFEALGSGRPTDPIYGCDIDLRAFVHLKKLARPKPISSHFIKADFLQLAPANFRVAEFDVVIGNPPYVSYHNMFDEQRRIAVQIGKLGDFQLGRISSLWAYFVLHGLKFLKVGGRAAWILPGSLLNADYGKELLHGVSPHFDRVAVVSLSQRLFLSEGTDESSEILLCDGWKLGPARHGVEVRTVATLEQCRNLISSWHDKSWRGASLNGRVMFTVLSHKALAEYHELLKSESVTTLGKVAKVLIGIVTGDNGFFIIDRETAKKAGISLQQLSSILSKFRLAPGLILKPGDLMEARKSGERCLLVNRHFLERSAPAVKRYLERLPKDAIQKNATFAKRSIWHCPDDGKIPDGFFPYMNHIGPRLVLNSAAVNSTNTVHRVYFKPGITASEKKVVAISMLSTFSQLSSEIEGRTYGSGVLKHEPSEATNIHLFLPKNISASDITRTGKTIDRLLRARAFDEARDEADLLVFGRKFLAENEKLFAGLHRALKAARKRRY